MATQFRTQQHPTPTRCGEHFLSLFSVGVRERDEKYDPCLVVRLDVAKANCLGARRPPFCLLDWTRLANMDAHHTIPQRAPIRCQYHEIVAKGSILRSDFSIRLAIGAKSHNALAFDLGHVDRHDGKLPLKNCAAAQWRKTQIQW